MESIDRLREACEAHGHTGCSDIPHAICSAFGLGHRPYDWGTVLIPVCDAIEAELAERYMELPLDADGVPVHLNDEMEFIDGERFDVMGIGANGTLFYLDKDCAREWTQAGTKCHHRPDTWERIKKDAYQLDVALGEGTEECTRTGAVRDLVARCEALAGGVR